MFKNDHQHQRDCPAGSLFGFNRFGVDAQTAQRLLRTALAGGGDYADLYFEYSTSDDLQLRDGQVNSTMYDIDYGMGVRVLCGDKTGYAYTENTTMEQMETAARMASAIANSPAGGKMAESFAVLPSSDRYPVSDPWSAHSTDENTPLLMRLNDLCFQADSRVVKVQAKLSVSYTEILFANSLGQTCSDVRPLASLVLSVVMQEGSRIETSSSSRSYRRDRSMFTEALIDEMVEEAVSQCRVLFEASRPSGGKMAVVMGAGSSGILLHEAIGHAFEADFNRKNTSIFADRMGELICDSHINIVDDGTVLYNRGSINFDDEGVPGQKTYMVRDGRLESYLHDRISASFYGVAPTGNGRRESFRFSPLPRMRATYMEGGNCREEEIIADVKKGLYVNNFSNGQVQIGAGDFTFYVKNGYLIENGRLTRPVKDVNIIGNGPKALADIIAVADNPRIDDGTWTCGKGQYCAVSCGMPSVLVKQLTVGGM